MTRFAQSTRDDATVPASADQVWARLTDPDTLVRMTPLLEHITADGDTWTWRMRRIAALGVGITPVFTEAMTFTESRHIAFRHAPPPGARQRTGVEGSYDLTPADGGTHLAIRLRVEVDLPLPGAAGLAVRTVMRQTMGMMGAAFARNLLAEIGPR